MDAKNILCQANLDKLNHSQMKLRRIIKTMEEDSLCKWNNEIDDIACTIGQIEAILDMSNVEILK
jgi:hypothetical protein